MTERLVGPTNRTSTIPDLILGLGFGGFVDGSADVHDVGLVSLVLSIAFAASLHRSVSAHGRGGRNFDADVPQPRYCRIDGTYDARELR